MTSDKVSSTSAGVGAAGVISVPFLICSTVLAVAAVMAGPVASWMDLRHAKEPLPLRSPLAALDADGISPYRVLSRQVLDPGIVEALGTDQYLSWTIEDTTAPEASPLRRGYLFVTYYTGGRNLVPHTPDVCYLGSGYEAAQPHENQDLSIGSVSTGEVPVRICTFAKTAVFNRTEFTVVYTFFANGQFAGTRTGVRVLLNDPRNRHAFFSKVEASFPGAGRDDSIEGARKLFAAVLPVLMRNHWPDFGQVETHAGEVDRQPGLTKNTESTR